MPSAPPAFECLDLSFSVQTSDPKLERWSRTSTRPARAGARPTIEFSVMRVRGFRYAIHRGSTCVRTTNEPAIGARPPRLGDQPVRGAGSARAGQILLHAAAAALHKRQLLPAASGSGKSTLVAALVPRVLVPDRRRGCCRRQPGTRAPLPEAARRSPRTAAQVPAGSSATGGSPSVPRRRGVPTARGLGGTVGVASPPTSSCSLATGHTPPPVPSPSVGRTVQLLAEQSFDLHTYGPGALDLLASVSTGCRRFALEYSDLDEAAAFIMQELGPRRMSGGGGIPARSSLGPGLRRRLRSARPVPPSGQG